MRQFSPLATLLILLALVIGCTTTHQNSKNPKTYTLTPEQADNLVQNIMVQRYTVGVTKIAFGDGRIGYQKISRLLLDSDEIALIAEPLDNTLQDGKNRYRLKVVRSGTKVVSGQVEASALYDMAEKTADAILSVGK
ncbi:hypothetical protein [Prosthecobacter sp.]